MPAVSPTLLAVLTIGVVALILGILIGSYTIPPISEENKIKLNVLKQFTENRYYGQNDPIVKSINEGVSRERLRQNLKLISSEPHLPGSVRDHRLAEYVRDQFLESGLDRAYLVPYNVLLSYSNTTNPNKVYIINGNDGSVLFESQHRESPVRDGENEPNFVDAYNSFAPKADVTGDPVFCNYGREEDFDYLQFVAKIDLKGKICLIKYGKIFRGNKCDNAAQRGIIGVILYSDPLEMAREGTKPENLYPNQWWMNGRAMQRGNLRTSMGDVLTPGFPALVDGAFHYQINDSKLPKIPSQPIGYDDALSILKLMAGIPVPNTYIYDDWNGGLNITYRLGPGFQYSANANPKLRLIVNNVLKTQIIYNVIGILEGSVEADRYVILGNHRDAWGLGAMDAASGTTALLEVARLFGHFHNQSEWRPRRTLVFASWTAEEFGLIGSTEWVEEHIHVLDKAVAYINVDTCIKGPHLSPDASPALMDILREVTQYIPFGNNTLLNAWIEYQEYITGVIDRPNIKTLGSGTDHAPFAFYAGIPAINIEFTFDKKKYPISGYPAYHTGYETFYLVEHFIDPDFSLHQTCSQLIGVLMHAISGSTLLPFRIDELAERVAKDYQNMWREDRKSFISKIEMNSETNRPLIKMLEKSIENFVKAAKEWTKEIKDLDLSNPYLVRQLNDAVMGVERAFIAPEGLYERPEIRNVLYAPFKYNKYSTVVFPGMLDLMKKISDSQRSEPTIKVQELWLLLHKHISDIAIALRSATNLLKRSPL